MICQIIAGLSQAANLAQQFPLSGFTQQPGHNQGRIGRLALFELFPRGFNLGDQAADVERGLILILALPEKGIQCVEQGVENFFADNPFREPGEFLFYVFGNSAIGKAAGQQQQLPLEAQAFHVAGDEPRNLVFENSVHVCSFIRRGGIQWGPSVQIGDRVPLAIALFRWR